MMVEQLHKMELSRRWSASSIRNGYLGYLEFCEAGYSMQAQKLNIFDEALPPG